MKAETTEFSIGFVCQPERSLVETFEAQPVDSLWVGGHVASTNPSPEVFGFGRPSKLRENGESASTL